MDKRITVAELFAGVGGFRLGLEGLRAEGHPSWNLPSAGPFETIWANQWEPGSDARQFAARCYARRFGTGELVNRDIHLVMNEAEAGALDIPAVDMVVGGFPCQDYSVARSLSQAGGIEGKKGVLWWDIFRFLKYQIALDTANARWCLFENVDRLLKSPASRRGRDFAIILSCLASLGYAVEWRVVNSAAYGFSQRRKRVYIFAERAAPSWDIDARLRDGVMQGAFPMSIDGGPRPVTIPPDPFEATRHFNEARTPSSPFLEAGVMVGDTALTCHARESYDGVRGSLGDVLVPETEVPASYVIPSEQLPRWEYLKGAKRVPRKNKLTGHEYVYSEGAMAFPDLLENPSRTILTGEGGTSPSRFKHVVKVNGRYRRLVPDELDRLQGFPKGWTATGMTDGQRAFCMGNALVVGIPNRIGKAIVDVADEGRRAHEAGREDA